MAKRDRAVDVIVVIDGYKYSVSCGVPHWMIAAFREGQANAVAALAKQVKAKVKKKYQIWLERHRIDVDAAFLCQSDIMIVDQRYLRGFLAENHQIDAEIPSPFVPSAVPSQLSLF